MPHVPVLLAEVLEALEPIRDGVFIDATFGAGGYSRALLERGAAQVIGIDRDPVALAMGRALTEENPGRLVLVEGAFADLEEIAGAHARGPVEGVVLDLGVSSIQLDAAERGFSFQRDGPLDMRMGREGPSAADLVNRAEEGALVDILRRLGEERAARRIARTVVAARARAPILRTGQLAELVAGCLPRPRPGQIHPATRTFQALRIAVNDELGQLVRALAGAEAVLTANGRLVVVTFHSLEDRIVKRYFRIAAGREAQASRHAPALGTAPPSRFRDLREATPDAAELASNPRARSARLRAARRTEAPAVAIDPARLGLPTVPPAAELLARGRR